VFEETRAETIEFSDAETGRGRPLAATWRNKAGDTGRIAFEWLIDASGRQGIMSTKYLKNRIYREGLRNVAVYGYWKNTTIYDKGGPRQNSPVFESLVGKLSLRSVREHRSH